MADATTLRNTAAMPTGTNSSGLVSGSSMNSRSSLICSESPPTSPKLTPPASPSVLYMWKTVGSTSRGSTRVVMSSATPWSTRSASLWLLLVVPPDLPR